MKLEAKIFLRVKGRYDDIMHWEETVLNIFRSLLLCVGCLVCGWLQIKPHKHRGTRNNECLDLWDYEFCDYLCFVKMECAEICHFLTFKDKYWFFCCKLKHQNQEAVTSRSYPALQSAVCTIGFCFILTFWPQFWLLLTVKCRSAQVSITACRHFRNQLIFSPLNWSQP